VISKIKTIDIFKENKKILCTFAKDSPYLKSGFENLLL